MLCLRKYVNAMGQIVRNNYWYATVAKHCSRDNSIKFSFLISLWSKFCYKFSTQLKYQNSVVWSLINHQVSRPISWQMTKVNGLPIPLPLPLISKFVKKITISSKHFDTMFVCIWHYQIFVILYVVRREGKRTLIPEFTWVMAISRKDLNWFVIPISNNNVAFIIYR